MRDQHTARDTTTQGVVAGHAREEAGLDEVDGGHGSGLQRIRVRVWLYMMCLCPVDTGTQNLEMG